MEAAVTAAVAAASEPAFAQPVVAASRAPETALDDALYEPADLSYEPDQERRDKFFSRLSRWAKK